MVAYSLFAPGIHDLASCKTIQRALSSDYALTPKATSLPATTAAATFVVVEVSVSALQQFELVRILRKPAVAERTGLGKSTIDQMVRRGQFPPPLRLTRHAVGWRVEDVDAWLRERDVMQVSPGA
jgi:prophage regulatory protein